jgi:acid phosphatase family membrane protein YuiD
MHISGTSLEVFLASATATFSAQLVKCLIYWLFQKSVNFKTLVHTGGMPSSHSALVASLSVSVGLISGFDGMPFAVSLGFATIVMYDAAGLRRAAGKMAGILNKLTHEIYSDHTHDTVPERLRELLGHTPIEVIAGAFWGAAIAYFYHCRLL